MPSQFFGLVIGASGLSAFQTAINTTANNISNVQTQGYSRQETTIEATDALRVYSRYGSCGTGAAAVSIMQQRNLYYDQKYWENNSSLGLYEEKLYYLKQIEDFMKDDSTMEGFSTIFGKMFNGLKTLATNNADETVRNQFINQAQSCCTYFNHLATGLSKIQDDCNEEIKSSVDYINATAQKIALLNREINQIEVRGGYANELRDERAKLIDGLSKVVDVETTEQEVFNTYGENLGGTNYIITVNGQVLVDGNDSRALECVPREYKQHQTDLDGLYDIVWADTKTAFAANEGSSGGSLKALYLVRDGNNNENLYGTVSELSSNNTLRLDNPSITNINSLNIPAEGTIRIQGREYVYTGWSAELDKDGKISSVSFDLALESNISTNALVGMQGKKVECGDAIDAMGIPYYQQQTTEFVRNFVSMFNAIEQTGVDLDGNPMGAFFVGTGASGAYEFGDCIVDTDGNYVRDLLADDGVTVVKSSNISSSSDSYYQLTAANVAVNDKSLKNPRYFSTTTSIINGDDRSEVVEELLKLESDVTIFRGNDAESFLETLLSDVTVDTQKTEKFQKNYYNLSITIDNQRMSVSGVDEDEEAINLVKFQNAYNLASKVISVMAEIYDKLINQTGV